MKTRFIPPQLKASALSFVILWATALVAKAQYSNLQIEDAPEQMAQTDAAPATQPPSGEGQTTPNQPQQQKLVRVATLNTVQANLEFQRNIQIIQGQRQRAVELNTAMESAANGDEREKLKKELDALLAKLEENHQLMLKTYGFSLARNYSLVIERAHVYMFVSDEEAANYEAQIKELQQHQATEGQTTPDTSQDNTAPPPRIPEE